MGNGHKHNVGLTQEVASWETLLPVETAAGLISTFVFTQTLSQV
jgi:hypothetical protein